MQPGAGGWSCAEVSMTRSLGYGACMFVVRDTGHLALSAVLATRRHPQSLTVLREE